MPIKMFTPEQTVGKLRQIEVSVSQGKTGPLACKEAELRLKPSTGGGKNTAACKRNMRGPYSSKQPEFRPVAHFVSESD